MNVKEYIASGIVESYVLGLLPETDRQEFESLCIQYPEIAAARNSFEMALEEQLLADAKTPPQHLRQEVLDKLSNTTNEPSYDELQEERTPVRNSGIWKWLAAASLILLAAAAYWAFTSNIRYSEARAKVNDLENRLKQTEAQLASQQKTDRAKSDFKMAAIKEATASASIYWDTISKDVYLMINNMPQPASNKQYQLWAIMPDEDQPPVDLGTIEMKQERVLYRMKNVQEAKAFAITLEPRGGSKSPTTTPMISGQPVDL